ncbi:MAG: glycosyltransferase family 2 protein [Bacteroidota bacterium]
MEPLVSIIIPTYNRVHFIGETLESIIYQSYQNWECLVVDDGSTDYTDELMEFYCEVDNRIQYHHRPEERPKGANACRNYGLELSKGIFVNWFDSDDLMLPHNIDSKVKAFKTGVDMVISNTLNFDSKGAISRPYKLNYDLAVTAVNFVTGRIGWITNDAMIRREAINIKFDERLQSDQEYNFFSRFLLNNEKVIFLKKDIAKRRIHTESIQNQLKTGDKLNRETVLFKNEILLFDALPKSNSPDLKIRSLKRLIRLSYCITPKFKVNNNQFQLLRRLKADNHPKAVKNYLVWMTTNLISGKGYFFIKKANRSLN